MALIAPRPLAGSLAMLSVFTLTTGCAVTSHDRRRAELGVARPSSALLAVIDQPGPVELTTVVAADWAVERSGLINLDHPRAKAAGQQDGDEPIQVYFHVLRHPQRGLFAVDAGLERALGDHPDQSHLSAMVRSKMNLEQLHLRTPLGDWLSSHPAEPLRGVFLTHLHLDHSNGLADLPAGTQLYVGPGEGAERAFLNLFVQGSIDRALEGKAALQELPFSPDADGRFEGVVDVFGDGSVWALLVPGHTQGSIALVVRTPQGPVLLTGDACHTRWGWEHDVEPGSFSSDRPRSAESLARLRRLAAEHPGLEVRLGHQRLPLRQPATNAVRGLRSGAD